MTAPERHNDTARNLILNRAVDDLSRIINEHDPENDTPIAHGVWDRLDKLALEIEARAPAPVTPDKFSAVDHMSRVADTWMHKAVGLQREIDRLSDPVTVHANMLRGTIAKPTVDQIIHLYGVDALVKALAPVIVREAGNEPS